MSAPLSLAPASAGLLPRASTFAEPVDHTFLVLSWLAVFLVVLLGGLLLVLATSRAAADGAPRAAPRRLFQIGALCASALVALLFLQGSRVWADMQVPPRGAPLVQVAVGEKGWTFTYPGGHTTDELHLPLGEPVRLRLAGAHEPYTLAVPAFRLQVPVAQGQGRDAWVQATLPGEYAVRSTVRPARGPELAAVATVHPEGGFQKWLQDVSGPPLDLPPIELGQRSYQMRGCTQCHTTDGSKLVGPSFQGFLAREHRLKDGSLVEPSDEYIRESILDPQAKVVQGFEPVMPSFRGRLHDLEVAGLVEYIKSLK